MEYRLQLEQVQLALKSDSENKELQELEKNLMQLIELSGLQKKEKSLNESKTEVRSNSEKKTAEFKDFKEELKEEKFKFEQQLEWKVGETCLAKKDTEYFKATITTITADRKRVSVQFKESEDSKLLSVKELRKYSEKKVAPKKEHRQSNRPSKAQYIEKKEKEDAKRQSSWQKFTKKIKAKGNVASSRIGL